MVTKRWIFLCALVVSGLVLAGCGALPAASETPVPIVEPEQLVVVGEMPTPETSSSDVVEAVVEETTSEDMSGEFGMATACPTGESGLEVFATENYCLLYPPGFEVTQPEAGVVVIHSPDYGNGGPEPLTGYVNITVTPNIENLTAMEVSDRIVASLQPLDPSAMMERVEAPLGSERAVEIIGVPGLFLSWQVVAVHDGMVYTLTFAPLGEEYGQAFWDMDTLYNVVMPSFAFLP